MPSLAGAWAGIGMGLIGLALVWLYAVSVAPVQSAAKPAASPIVRRKAPDREAHLEKLFFFIVTPRSFPTPIYQKTQRPRNNDRVDLRGGSVVNEPGNFCC